MSRMYTLRRAIARGLVHRCNSASIVVAALLCGSSLMTPPAHAAAWFGLGPATASLLRRAIGSAVAGTYVLAVVVLFWYFYPILAGKIIPYSSWLAHMWYHGWI